MTRRVRSIVVLAVVASALPIATGALRPAGAAPEAVTGATLEWTVNDESNTGAFNGQCNFMSGGQSDGDAATYRASGGDATVLKLNAAGTYAPVSDYATRCKDRHGTTVTAGGTARLGQKVVFSNGTGTVDPSTGAATISWTGTFSINYYGTLTPFWFSDPTLTVGADGKGVVTATVGGYASSIDDPDVRELIDPIPGVTIATLTGVGSANRTGFVTTPTYAGVAYDNAEAPQIRSFPGWGSWPVSFVQAMERLGLGPYWYTSGGAADTRKVPAPIVVGYGLGSAPSTTTTPTTAPGSSTTTSVPGSTTTTTSVPPSSTTTTTTPPTSGSGGVSISAVVPAGPGTDVGGDTEVPPGLPADTFSWTIDAADGGVSLGRIPGGQGELRFGGQLPEVTVVDTREGSPAWSLSGQVSDFSGDVSGKFLGWSPRLTTAGAGAVPGGAIPSGLLAGDGLRSPSLLASAPSGHPKGSATVGADLDLRLPTSTPGGTYTATLTITALG
jgi:hypothetical protein